MDCSSSQRHADVRCYNEWYNLALHFLFMMLHTLTHLWLQDKHICDK